MTYNTCKKVIENQKAKGTLNKQDMLNKLDVFLLAGRLTEEEYNDLVRLMED